MNKMRQNLSLLLDQSGLKKIEIAERLGVHRNQLRSFLKGQSNITSESFCKILDFIGIDIAALIAKKLSDEIYKTETKTPSEAFEELYSQLSKVEKKILLQTLSQYTQDKPQLKDLNNAFLRISNNL